MTPTGIPWHDGFNWDVANYAPLTVGGALILFGGWWLISAKNWFKGPVRMGTEDELEQMEARQEAGFAVPADTQYETPRDAVSSWLRGAPAGAPRPFEPDCRAIPPRRRRSGRSPGR